MSSVVYHGDLPATGRDAVDAVLDVGERAMQRAVLLTEGEWKRRAERSRKTGHYLRNIYTHVRRFGNRVEGELGNPLLYAGYLERGTGLYGPANRWIVPKSKKAMRWPQAGSPGFTLAGRQRSGRAGEGARYTFARRVRGIRPRRFARDAQMVTEPRVTRDLKAAGVLAADEIARRGS